MLTELIVSYLGVFAGYGLSKIAKEEVKSGINNIKKLEYVLRIISVLAFVYFADMSTMYLLAIIVAFILITHIDNYASMGLLVGVSPTFILASLIFLYGFPAGSLMFKEDYKGVIKKSFLFLVFGIAGLLIRQLLL